MVTASMFICYTDVNYFLVLIDRSQHIKLCDFGFGNMIKQRHEVLNTYCGSPFYASPEMVTATPYRGPPADLWSCGVILYAMLTGSLPFQSEEMPQLFQKISRAQYHIPSYVGPEASDLIQRLLCRDARERITAEECLVHPWLKMPTSTRHSISSLNTLSRKKVSSSDTINKHYLTIEEEYDTKQPPFFTRLFRKKSQIAPTTAKNTSPSSSEKKIEKSRFILSKFTGLFKSSIQKRITDK